MSGRQKNHTSPGTTEVHDPQAISTSKLSTISTLEEAMGHLLDPVHGSISKGKTVCGAIWLHVDDLFMTGTSEFMTVSSGICTRSSQLGATGCWAWGWGPNRPMSPCRELEIWTQD